jgi:hypothetical protein
MAQDSGLAKRLTGEAVMAAAMAVEQQKRTNSFAAVVEDFIAEIKRLRF